MRQKIIAAAAALTLGSFAAVGAFASQDAVDLRSAAGMLSGGVLGAETTPDPSAATAEPTDTPDATETATEVPSETSTPEATSTESADETETPDVERSEDSDGHDGEVHGIPTSNPNHHPDDGDGECEKGETEVKTTPSGTQVNVPCQAAGEHGHGNDQNTHGDDTESGDDSSDGEDQQEED